ncbi:unnamed protein product, partial [Rotaria sordida]
MSSPSLLKQLTLNIDGHPSFWLSMYRLIRGTGKIFDRFPAFIHFTLYYPYAAALRNSIYNLSKM